MSRKAFPLLLVLAAVALTACGGDSGVNEEVRQGMVGRWIRDQESNDGGSKWLDRSDNLQVDYRADGTWIDNRDRTGTYHLNGSRITVYWPGHATRYARIRMLASNHRMEWVYYTSSSFGQTTGYRARYTRIR
ncbi:MAG TPA: hypothetical protein DCZ72_06565 [Armatimonadetes bacterium]|nr:hypothetical protein [Armatimonadota bacterium]